MKRAHAVCVLAVSIACLLHSCNKPKDKDPKPTPTPPPAAVIDYTSGMGGVRHWYKVDSANLHIPYNGHDTVIYSNDTFALTIVDEMRVNKVYPNLLVDSLDYLFSDSVAHVHYFTGTHTYGSWTNALIIRYNYADNSILFQSSGSGTGSTWIGQYERITMTTF